MTTRHLSILSLALLFSNTIGAAALTVSVEQPIEPLRAAVDAGGSWRIDLHARGTYSLYLDASSLATLGQTGDPGIPVNRPGALPFMPLMGLASGTAALEDGALVRRDQLGAVRWSQTARTGALRMDGTGALVRESASGAELCGLDADGVAGPCVGLPDSADAQDLQAELAPDGRVAVAWLDAGSSLHVALADVNAVHWSAVLGEVTRSAFSFSGFRLGFAGSDLLLANSAPQGLLLRRLSGADGQVRWLRSPAFPGAESLLSDVLVDAHGIALAWGRIRVDGLHPFEWSLYEQAIALETISVNGARASYVPLAGIRYALLQRTGDGGALVYESALHPRYRPSSFERAAPIEFRDADGGLRWRTAGSAIQRLQTVTQSGSDLLLTWSTENGAPAVPGGLPLRRATLERRFLNTGAVQLRRELTTVDVRPYSVQEPVVIGQALWMLAIHERNYLLRVDANGVQQRDLGPATQTCCLRAIARAGEWVAALSEVASAGDSNKDVLPGPQWRLLALDRHGRTAFASEAVGGPYTSVAMVNGMLQSVGQNGATLVRKRWRMDGAAVEARQYPWTFAPPQWDQLQTSEDGSGVILAPDARLWRIGVDGAPTQLQILPPSTCTYAWSQLPSRPELGGAALGRYEDACAGPGEPNNGFIDSRGLRWLIHDAAELGTPVSVAGRHYAVANQQTRSELVELNLTDGQRLARTPLPAGLRGTSAVAAGERVLVVAASERGWALLEFDPANSSWRQHPGVPQQHTILLPYAVDGQVWLFAGWSTDRSYELIRLQ